MKVETFKKTADYLATKPNLPDYDQAKRTFSWNKAKKEITYINGKLNAAYNAIDRNAKNWRKNKIALYWEGENEDKKRFTFQDLNKLSSQFANLLHSLEINRKDRVFFFLPRVPELYYGFLGALKRGAIAGTMFAAFGPQAIQDRLGNSDAKVLITNKELLPRVLKVLDQLPELETILLVDSDRDKKLKHNDGS
jgi:acetyl-CoA synthetase